MSIINRLWYGRSVIFICQNLTICNRLVVLMGGVTWRGGSQKVAKHVAITLFKMEDACILCNVIEVFLRTKVTKVKI